MGGVPKEKTMKCIVCHGQDIPVTEVNEELKLKTDIVYVRIHIPV